MCEREFPFILVTGGCRSGKSTWAQKFIESVSQRGLYLATAQARDEEMQDRINSHWQTRGEFWQTLEITLPQLTSFGGKLPNRNGQGILLDCLTLWCSGCMELGLDDKSIHLFFDDLLEDLWHLSCPVALVSNEVGMGIVPTSPMGRRFRDLAGMINQKAAAKATHVFFAVSGLPLHVKGNIDLLSPYN